MKRSWGKGGIKAERGVLHLVVLASSAHCCGEVREGDDSEGSGFGGFERSAPRQETPDHSHKS